MTSKTAYLRLLALSAFADADLIREELGGRDLAAFDCVADLTPRELPHSAASLAKYAVPLYPSQIKSIIPRIQSVADADGVKLRWGPRLAQLLKGQHENE
jgi:hypothetical protein